MPSHDRVLWKDIGPYLWALQLSDWHPVWRLTKPIAGFTIVSLRFHLERWGADYHSKTEWEAGFSIEVLGFGVYFSLQRETRMEASDAT